MFLSCTIEIKVFEWYRSGWWGVQRLVSYEPCGSPEDPGWCVTIEVEGDVATLDTMWVSLGEAIDIAFSVRVCTHVLVVNRCDRLG